MSIFISVLSTRIAVILIPAFHQKKHNITYLYFHSGKPIGFFTPTTGKWVFSCGNRHSKTGFWNLEVPGLYTLPIEFTGHPLKVSLDNDNSLYLFGIALGTKEQKDSPVYWFTEGEKAEHNSLITLQVDNALPPGKVRLLGAYANETSLLALWTSNSSLYSSKIASVDELTPYFGVITDGSQLKLTAIRTSILEGYQAIRDSLEKNTKQALRLKALKNEPRQHPASNLEPWGWIKINGQRLDSVANFFMNSYAGIFYPSSHSSLCVSISDLPALWEGTGQIHVEDTKPGALARINIYTNVYRYGKVVSYKLTPEDTPLLASGKKTSSLPIEKGELAKGVLVLEHRLYVCWIGSEGNTLGWEEIFALNSLKPDFFQLGRLRNLGTPPNLKNLENAFRRAFIAPSIAL